MAQATTMLLQPPVAESGETRAGQAAVSAPAGNAGLRDVAMLLPGYGRRSHQGDAALRAVAHGLLERVSRYGTLRVETIPATWPMTRHLVRRVADALVRAGLLERLPDGALRAPAGTASQVAAD